MGFRVMSFNVRMVTDRDGENRWPLRADLNVRVISGQAADLIGFQELQEAHLDVYRERLNGYERLLGPGVSSPVHEEHPAIFWNPDRFELLESGGFYLSTTPERWSRGWDAAAVRGATWARFRCRDSGAVILHCNTHLDMEGEQARVEGSRLIIERLDEVGGRGLPVVITGDFNAVPDSTTHALYLEHGFSDAWQAQDVPSFHGFRGMGSRRIDWIMTRPSASTPLRVLGTHIVRDAEPPLYPSDHYPVVADLSLGA